MSDFKSSWTESLVRMAVQAIKTNQTIINQGLETWRGQKKTADFSNLFLKGSALFSRGVKEYYRAGVEYSGRLVEIGRSLSEGFLAHLDENAAIPKEETQKSAEQTSCEVKMTGKPGDHCRCIFILESNKSETVPVRIRYSRFTDIESGAQVSMPLFIDPLETIIKPGEKLPFTIEAGIPEKLAPGSYHAVIWMDGFQDATVRVVLRIPDNAGEIQSQMKNPDSE